MPGGQQSRFAGLKGDECQCGRRETVRHCPQCGCSRVYGYARPEWYKSFLSGEIKQAERVFRCMQCSCKFTDAEREFCQAPPFTAALARLRAQRLYEASKSNDLLDPKVIIKAQELAGQQPDENLKAIAESEASYNEDQIKAIIDATNPLEFPEEIRDDPQKVRQYVILILEKEREEKKAQKKSVEQPEDIQPQQSEAQRESMSVAEMSFRREWATHKLAGDNKLPSVEEYIERRMKGELFE